MNLSNQKLRFLFATHLTLVAVFAVIFFGLVITPANVATDGWHIKDNATGGECSAIGSWNAGSKTCTLSQDLSQGIIIDSDNIILDGDGRTITGIGAWNTTGIGVYLYGKNGVTIKNLNIKDFFYGIRVSYANNNTFLNNVISSNYNAIVLDFVNFNSVLNNTISNNWNGGISFGGDPASPGTSNKIIGNTINDTYPGGIVVAYSNNFLITNNTITNSSRGIWLKWTSNNRVANNLFSNTYIGIDLGVDYSPTTNNVFEENTISNIYWYGIWIYGHGAQNNKFHHNNIIDATTPIIVQFGTGNVFNLPLPDGGNYWSNFDTSTEGCNDLNNDNFCDSPYVFTGGQDNLPWTKKDGWLAPQNNPPVASFTFRPENPKAGEEIYFNASNSYDPDPNGQIVRYEWDLDNDGVYDYSIETPILSTEWPLLGSFTVKLRVVDNNGADDIVTVAIFFEETPESNLSAFIIDAFRAAGNSRLWKDTQSDPFFKYFFPSYYKFRRIDQWLREDAIGNVSGKELDWFRNDQRFKDFSCIELADIITLLHEKISETGVSYESRILTTISEYRMADYALLRWQDNSVGLKQAEDIFNEISAQIVKFVPIVGELIVGDSTVDKEVLKGMVKTGTKVVAEEVLIRSGLAQEVAGDLSKFGVNIAWTAYKVYKGIDEFNDLKKFQEYENQLTKYFCYKSGISAGVCNLNLEQLQDDDKLEFEEMWQGYSQSFSAAGVSQVKLEELQNAVKAMILDNLEQNKNKLPNRLCVDANSPIEIRVLNEEGATTGLENGEIKEEIPYSVYDAVQERATIILPSGNHLFKVIGTDNGTYGLAIQFLDNGNVNSFVASDIPTSPSTIHQYTIDWDVLSQGEKGVTLQIDADSDGVFEQTIKADATLQPPTADINGSYEGNEGSSITFDASGSSDPDGEIILYEWDFDGDGVYDIASASPTAEHTWGDNYQGEITLRVTDDEGLTDITTTSVIINNVAPIISNLLVEGSTHPNQDIWAGDTLNFSGDFADSGWLDTHTAEWNFGNEITTIGTITQKNNPPAATGQVTGNYIYYNAGIYTITLTVTDDDGGVSVDTFQIAVKPIPAAINCNPDMLNLKSGGKWITCYIELPAGYDVWQINGSTVFLNGVIPIYLGKEGWAKPESNKSNIMDYDEDGILERMVKFDRETVQAILSHGQAVVLTVTGKVFSNQGLADFEGQDTIKVINRTRKLDEKEKPEKSGIK